MNITMKSSFWQNDYFIKLVTIGTGLGIWDFIF